MASTADSPSYTDLVALFDAEIITKDEARQFLPLTSNAPDAKEV